MLILYLQSTYPKIANLIQILYIVCRALRKYIAIEVRRVTDKNFAVQCLGVSTVRNIVLVDVLDSVSNVAVL